MTDNHNRHRGHVSISGELCDRFRAYAAQQGQPMARLLDRQLQVLLASPPDAGHPDCTCDFHEEDSARCVVHDVGEP